MPALVKLPGIAKWHIINNLSLSGTAAFPANLGALSPSKPEALFYESLKTARVALSVLESSLQSNSVTSPGFYLLAILTSIPMAIVRRCVYGSLQILWSRIGTGIGIEIWYRRQKPIANSDCDADPDADSDIAFPAALNGSQNKASGSAGGYLLML